MSDITMTTPHGQLLLRVDRPELVAHFIARAHHHEERLAHWAKEAERQEADLTAMLSRAETTTDRIQLKSSSNFSNVGSMRDSARNKVQEHARRARFFEFVGEHVPDTPSAFLTVEQLQSLELIPSTY